MGRPSQTTIRWGWEHALTTSVELYVSQFLGLSCRTWARCPLTTALPCSLFQGCVGDTHCQNNLGWVGGENSLWLCWKAVLRKPSTAVTSRELGDLREKQTSGKEWKREKSSWALLRRWSEGEVKETAASGQLLFYNKNIFITLIFRSYLCMKHSCAFPFGAYSGDSLLSASNENTI